MGSGGLWVMSLASPQGRALTPTSVLLVVELCLCPGLWPEPPYAFSEAPAFCPPLGALYPLVAFGLACQQSGCLRQSLASGRAHFPLLSGWRLTTL